MTSLEKLRSRLATVIDHGLEEQTGTNVISALTEHFQQLLLAYCC